MTRVFPGHDFETYSEAGYVLRATGKWGAPAWAGKRKPGLSLVGTRKYVEHPSTRVLSLAYDLLDGRGPRLWLPSMPPPLEWFAYLLSGGEWQAQNAAFECDVWEYICHRRMGWPQLPQDRVRDTMARAQAFSLPGALADMSKVLGLPGKQADGTALIQLFSCPPGAKSKGPYLPPERHPRGPDFWSYNVQDVVAEADVAARVPELRDIDERFYLSTLKMNQRGIAIDLEGVRNLTHQLDAFLPHADAEITRLTGEAVETVGQVGRLIKWLATQGIHVETLDADDLEELMELPDLSPLVTEVLTLRQLAGGAGVKKLWRMLELVGSTGRIHHLFTFNGAHTGRDTAREVQPQNLPKKGPKTKRCEGCGAQYGKGLVLDACPACGCNGGFAVEHKKWSPENVYHASRCPDLVKYYPSPVLAASGCVRGMFVPGPGFDFICSDYSSVEAVVTAALAGEQWRLDAFAAGSDIYLESCSRITGKSIEWYRENGWKEHPDRQKLGKPCELALGFGGWINAWYQFDKSGNLSEAEIKKIILAWRDASPAVVELWGGQARGKPWRPDSYELFGLEGMAIAATNWPGERFSYRGLVTYFVKNDVLHAQLPSGRCIYYHCPRLDQSERYPDQLQLSYEGYNTNPKNGAKGWKRSGTYGGRLTENAVQGIANDLLRVGTLAVESTGKYFPVMRVHDELLSEVPSGLGDLAEYEALMAMRPPWAIDWPLKASGGWIGDRYRKD